MTTLNINVYDSYRAEEIALVVACEHKVYPRGIIKYVMVKNDQHAA